MDNTTGDPALETALFMAELGARVFPISSGRKTPILQANGRTGDHGSRHHPRMGRAEPRMQLGDGLERISRARCRHHGGDVDGHNALASLEEEHGKIETWMAHTPRNGRHYHFSRSKARYQRPSPRVASSSAAMATMSCSGIEHTARDISMGRRAAPAQRAPKPSSPNESCLGYFTGKANGKTNGAGQLATPHREMASGQRDPHKTALAEWFDTEVQEGGRNHALARGVGLMAAAGTPMPAAMAAAKWWCRHRCRPPLVGPEVGATFSFDLQGRGQEADHRTG